MHNLYAATRFPLRIAFVLNWIATATLLRKYSKTIGRLRFWTSRLASTCYINYWKHSDLRQLYCTIIAGYNPTILCSLWCNSVRANLFDNCKGSRKDIQYQHSGAQLREGHNERSRSITRYLRMAVFGTVLFLVTNTPSNRILVWVHIPYPPLADVVWSFIGFAAYFYSFGLYLSVISISHDANLRKSIQKLSIEETDMPHRRGSTQMQQEIQKQVVKLSREQEEVLKE